MSELEIAVYPARGRAEGLRGLTRHAFHLPRVVLLALALIVPCASAGGQEPEPGKGAAKPISLAFGPGAERSSSVDPAVDGWDSEVLSSRVDAHLKHIADWIGAGEIAAHEVEVLVEEGFECSDLSAVQLEERFSDGTLVVRRAPTSWSGTRDRADDDGGRDGADCFAGALRDLSMRLEGLDARRAKFKLFGIDLTPAESSFVTRSYFEASGRGGGMSRQINSLWTSRWSLPAEPGAGDPPASTPRLLAVEVTGYEETEAHVEGGALFEEVTVSALAHNLSYREHLLQSPEHWLSRLTKSSGFTKNGWQGISVADTNGDGLEDLFLPEQGGLPNRLFVQRSDGRFDDRSASSGVDLLERTLAGLFVDLDNDGDPDLVLSSRPAVVVLENDGAGGFQRLRFAASMAPDSHSLSAADYDLDGDLDLYICAYQRAPHERDIASPIPYHDANNGGRNALLRNDGDFSFTDVTEESGLDTNNRRFSLAASWEDFDNDGDPDLYVANDYGRNNLYRNDGVDAGGRVRFSDVAAEYGVEDISSGMSVSWGDYNRDGRMDLYVGNMFSAAGNRITYQRKFEQERQQTGPLSQIQRMARGNSLFENRTGPASLEALFVDRSEVAGVSMGRWAWSSVFADLNNDGFEDLVVANGNLTQTNPDDL